MDGCVNNGGEQIPLDRAGLFPVVWDLRTPRGENQIGMREALAEVLGFYTLFEWWESAAVTIYVANGEVKYSLVAGTSRCKEIALMVARMWQVAATQRWGLPFRRIETKANAADGPASDDFSSLDILNATWC